MFGVQPLVRVRIHSFFASPLFSCRISCPPFLTISLPFFVPISPYSGILAPMFICRVIIQTPRSLTHFHSHIFCPGEHVPVPDTFHGAAKEIMDGAYRRTGHVAHFRTSQTGGRSGRSLASRRDLMTCMGRYSHREHEDRTAIQVDARLEYFPLAQRIDMPPSIAPTTE